MEEALLSNTLKDENVHFYFVNKKGKNNSDGIMSQAFARAIDSKLKAEWILEEDCLKKSDLKKTYVFVLKEFQGHVFDHLSTQDVSCLIVGPRCLISALSGNIPIPYTKSPIFTMAMNGLIITCSNIPLDDKERVKVLVGYMGGIYSSNLIPATTHLVVGRVSSNKYHEACRNGIKVMTQDWIGDVWKASIKGNISATDDALASSHVCPIFYNMRITGSALTKSTNQEIKNIISRNGGKYSGVFSSTETNVLITTQPNGEKFKLARKKNVSCVKPEWVKDSESAGYALPFKEYLWPDKPQCSTPEKKNVETAIEAPSFMSVGISMIHDVNEASRLDETRKFSNEVDFSTVVGKKAIPARGCSSSKFATPAKFATPSKFVTPMSPMRPTTDFSKSVDDIDLEYVRKKLAFFLEGYNILLNGFTSLHEEKLKSVLKYAGAVRYTEMVPTVSHIIVADTRLNLPFSVHNNVHVVTVDWLKESILKGHPLPETSYYVKSYTLTPTTPGTPKALKLLSSPVGTPSPLSKKGLRMLDNAPSPYKTVYEEDEIRAKSALSKENKSLLEHYQRDSQIEQPIIDNQMHLDNDFDEKENEDASKKAQSRSEVSNLDVSLYSVTSVPDNSQLFKDLTFVIVGHDAETTTDIKVTIEGLSGKVISSRSRAIADYAVVPFETESASQLKFTATEMVTHIWVDECVNSRCIVEPKYYHRPLVLPELERKPLESCVITFTGFPDLEKIYLERIVTALGAKYQEVLSRVENPAKNALKTTHLLCESAKGAKYNAAAKWGLPIVSRDWLLDSFKRSAKIPIESYLIAAPSNGTSGTANSRSVSSEGNVKCATNTPTAQSNFWSPSQDMDTPDTPYGRVFQHPDDPPPSPTTRKRIKRRIEGMIDYRPKHLRDKKPSMGSPSSDSFSDLSSGDCIAKLWSKFNVPPPNSSPLQPSQLLNRMGSKENVSRPFTVDDDGPSKIVAKCQTPVTMAGKIDNEVEAEHEFAEKFRNFELDEILTPATKNLRERLANKTMFTQTTCETPRDRNSFRRILYANKSPHNELDADEEDEDNKKYYKVCWNNGSDALPEAKSSREKSEEDVIVPRTKKYSLMNASDDSLLAAAVCEIPNEDEASVSQHNPTPPPVKYFMLSNIETKRKERYKMMLDELGGVFLSGRHYESEGTHLVMDKPICSEKFLCVLAASRTWVLHTSYIDASYKNGQFLPEEAYEWGNPLSVENLPQLEDNNSSKSLMECAHRWRCKEEGGQAYSRYKAIVYSNNASKQKAYERLIKAGGGQVLDLERASEATHCFLEIEKGSDSAYRRAKDIIDEIRKVNEVRNKKIDILQPLYLSEVLTSHVPPNPQNFAFKKP